MKKIIEDVVANEKMKKSKNKNKNENRIRRCED